MKKILSTVLALAILLSSTTLVTPSLAYTSYIEEVVLLVNEARAENGLSPLYVHPDLTSAAAIRALELDQYFSHDRPDGSSCFTVYDTELTYSYSYAGENIAQGHTTPADVVKAWLNSPGHNANIMNTNFDTIGVGYSATKRSWVQMFTSSSGGSPGTLLDGPTGNLVATSITLSATSLALGIGDTTTISGWIVPSSLSLSWSSSDPSVASVSSNGTVTPKSEGVAIITASGGGLTETCTVTVTTTTPEPIVPVELFDFNPSRLTMLVGESNTLNVHFYPSNATEKGVIYSSQDPSIVTVTTDGVATAISAGIGIITGTTVDGSITKSCTITVDDSNLKANYFTLSKNQVALNVGETTSITATFSPITATNTDLVWTSLSPSVATVSQSGVITAVGSGTTSIKVEGSNLPIQYCSVTVAADESTDLSYLEGASDWAHDLLSEAYDTGLLDGMSDIMSKYTSPISREEFCRLVINVYESTGKTAPTGANPFTDTTNTDVISAYYLGIVSGNTATTFGSDRSIKRQDLAVMVLRTAELFENISNLSTTTTFLDHSNITSYAVEAISYAQQEGFLQGTNGFIRPSDELSCQESIIVALRLAQKFG